MTLTMSPAVPYVEPLPSPASYEPGYWIIPLMLLIVVPACYLIWLAAGGILRVRGGRRPYRTVAEAVGAFLLSTAVALAVIWAGQTRADDRMDAYYAAEGALEDQVEAALNEYYGIEITSSFYLLPRGVSDPIEILRDGVVVDCYVHVVDERYAISCGGEDLESSAELPAGGVGA